MSQWLKYILDNFEMYSSLPYPVAVFSISKNKPQRLKLLKSNNEFEDILSIKSSSHILKEIEESIVNGYNSYLDDDKNNDFSLFFDDRIIKFVIKSISSDAFTLTIHSVTDKSEINGSSTESEKFFMQIIESLDDPVFVKDEAHRWVYLNDALCDQIDIPREALIGKTDYDVFPKHQADIFWEKDDEVFRSGNTNINEEEITFKGKKRTIITKKLLWVDPNTNKKYITGSIRDITDQKINEAILLESKRQYELAVKSGNIGIWNYDIKNNDYYLDPIVKTFIGYSEFDDLNTMEEWIEHIHPDDKDRVRNLFKLISKEKRSFSLIYRLIHKDGSTVWLLVHGNLIYNEQNEPHRLMGTATNITEQKETELALKESEKKLETILNNLPEAVIEVDLKGNINFVNQVGTIFSGLDHKSMIGMNILNLDLKIIDSDYNELDISDSPIKRALTRGEKTIGNEFGIQREDHVKWIMSNVVPLYKEGKIYGAIASYKDITLRKEYEQKIIRNEERYRNIFQNIQNVYYEHDIDGNILELSPSVKFVSGFEREELIGQKMQQFPSDVEVYNKYLDLLKENGFVKDYTIELVNKDGERQTCVLNSSLVGKGKNPKIVGSLSDITKLVEAEATLKMAHQKLRAVFDTIPGMIYVVDKEYKLLEISNNILNKYKLKSYDEAYGRKCYELLYNRSTPCSGCIVGRVFNIGVPTSSDFHPDIFSHSEKTYKLYSSPIKNEDEKIWATAQLLIDISDQHKTQAELKNMIVALKVSNRLTEEKAKEIQQLNKRLQESERELKHLNASKDKFFSIIAHDLKSPFQGFLSLSRMMLKDIDILTTEDLKELAKDLNDSANGIFKLLENLLQWSRVQRGSIEYHPSKYSLRSVVQSNIEILNGNAKSKFIDLNNHIASGISVYSDINLLNTIIRNLISNAIKFSNYDSKIDLFAEPIDNLYVNFEVRDYGVGIEQETMDKLFKIDEHWTTLGTANEKGTGLGLILCRELAEKNGGSIRVESQIGKGSSFIVSIPLYIDQPIEN